jgi:hypothetical protein
LEIYRPGVGVTVRRANDLENWVGGLDRVGIVSTIPLARVDNSLDDAARSGTVYKEPLWPRIALNAMTKISYASI